MCVGLFGVQIVWGLHNVNTSRIFQTLGADVSELPLLWIAAPLSGLLVQPVIGYFSDRTWTRIGRRRPYLLAGAVLSALSLFAMPNASTLWAGSLMLWILTASINTSMEPFRALVADRLPEEQRTQGYALQVFFIGAGAVFASVLPWVLTHWFGVDAQASAGVVSPAVHAAYYVGGICVVAAVAWTVFSTPEDRFIPARDVAMGAGVTAPQGHRMRGMSGRGGLLWAAGGALLALIAVLGGYSREIYFVAAISFAYGVLQLVVSWLRQGGVSKLGMLEIVEDIRVMPAVLRRLGLVQFFTWFGLFTMWIYTIPAVAARQYGATDATDAAYNAGADWVGILFAGYNGIAAIVALLLPGIAARVGRRACHAACLMFGAVGLTGFLMIDDPVMLWLPIIGIGIAWASILSIPYALVSSAVPYQKTGVYMGIHNIFLVIPQLVAAIVLGPLVGTVFGGNAVWALAISATCLALAALCTLAIPHAGRARG
ncbi:MAG: MFS transporter [Alphaproteobacteria bacterium]|nr:MAG: MFS transporter [Alphaproteobacteria bacterium]